MRICTTAVTLMAVVTGAGVASAQSFNVNFGNDGPPSTYGAAGAVGTWNTLAGENGTPYHLVDIDNKAGGVILRQSPSTTLMIGSDPSVTGDDAKLMNAAVITFDASEETCLTITGLTPDTYEVLMYAWMPSGPTVKSRTRQDLQTATIDVGGAWPGEQQQGVTYARYVLDIDSSGVLGSHSGIVPGANAQAGAALNGIQIRPLSSGSGGDGGGGGTDGGTGSGGSGNPDNGDAGTSSHTGSSGCDSGGASGPAGLVLVGAMLVGARRRRRG